jgi:hypothetical protein
VGTVVACVSFREVFRQKYGHLGIIISGIEKSMRLSSVLKKMGDFKHLYEKERPV